jgi:hypothetical protein
VLAAAFAPQERTIPEVLHEPVQGPCRTAEKGGGPGHVDRVAADDQRLEDLQMPTVEAVQGPLDAGTRAGPSGQ